MIDVSVVVVSFNTKELLLECLASVKKHTKRVSYEVIVVDNASTDGTVKAIKDIRDVQLIRNKKNVGFAKANNQGIKKTKGRYVLLLNSDTALREDSLTKMVMWMDDHKKVGIATCKLVNPDGSTQATGGSFPNLLRVFLWATFLDDLPFVSGLFGSFHPHVSRGVFEKEHRQDWVTGAFLLVRKEILEKIGALDEEFFMYVEEVDFCFRAKRAGWQVWYVPATQIVHESGASASGSTITFLEGVRGREGSVLGEFKGLKKFYKKHYPAWQFPALSFLLRLAAFLRIIVFGIFGRQKEAWKIYAKALATA